jgi:rubrerythrin
MESIENRLQDFSFIRNSIKEENRNSPFYLFGVACGEGWHNLIYDLCEEIESKAPDTIVMQIKEKFGGLRFYTSAHTDEVEKIIEKYEEKALTTCEVCGKDGKVRTGGWIQVLCDEHYKK